MASPLATGFLTLLENEMQCIALMLDMTIRTIDLTEEEVLSLKEDEELSMLDFDCHHIFLEEGDWEKFKKQVNQY